MPATCETCTSGHVMMPCIPYEHRLANAAHLLQLLDIVNLLNIAGIGPSAQYHANHHA